MRKRIYLAIINALKAEIPAIRHYDLWNQNVEFYEDYIFDTPAVFIEFDTIRYSPLKSDTYRGTVTVRLHVVTRQSSVSADGSYSQQQALEFLDLLSDIQAVVTRLSTDGCTIPELASSMTNHDHEQLMENIEEFNIRFTERFDRKETEG